MGGIKEFGFLTVASQICALKTALFGNLAFIAISGPIKSAKGFYFFK
jgi:hypothetical protein